MTSITASKKNVAASSIPTTPAAAPETGITMTDGSVGDISEMSVGAPAVDAFAASKSSAPKLPFNPPATPTLIDEKKDPQAREKNEAMITKYESDYAKYQQRYADAVRKAPDLETALKLGKPADFDPGLLKLPVNQRAPYDDLVGARVDLQNQRAAYEALGEKYLVATGEKHLPGSVAAIFELEVKRNGSGMKMKGEMTEQGLETKELAGAGFASHGNGVTTFISPTTHDASVEVTADMDGEYGAVELAADGTQSMEFGLDLHGTRAGVRSGVNPGEGKVELMASVGHEIAGIEGTARGGVAITFLGEKAAKKAIDSGDVFDPALLAAMRTVGR